MPPLRRGVCAALEAEADEWIRRSLVGVTKHSEKSDILTSWKQAERYRREVYPSTGFADNGRQGNFNRVINAARPDLNSRDGYARGAGRTGGLLQHIHDYDGGQDALGERS